MFPTKVTMEKKKCECTVKTKRTKVWPYDQYYIGDKDNRGVRSGSGESHWSSAQSMEYYTGRWIRDAMNGSGEYRWRYLGPKGLYFTYEGDFLANNMHGYGTMSFPDGRIFTGLFQKDVRFGPGVETHLSMNEDVGLWRGRQLVRLTWRPPGPSITPNLLLNNIGKSSINNHRVILTHTVKTKTSSHQIVESFTKESEDVLMALNLGPKLIEQPFFLTDNLDAMDNFAHDYYNGTMDILRTAHSLLELQSQESNNTNPDEGCSTMYFVWNNTDLFIQIMKRCYLQEQKRNTDLDVQLEKVLNGPRKLFKPAGMHEKYCRNVLMASYLGYIAVVAELINELNVYPDISDMHGNTALMYAACGDKLNIVEFLIEAGANINSYNDCCLTPLAVVIMKYVCIVLDIPPNDTAVASAFLPPTETVTDSNRDVKDWLISRDLPEEETLLVKQTSSITVPRPSSVLISLKGTSAKKANDQTHDKMIKQEYFNQVNNYFNTSIPHSIKPYIFFAPDLDSKNTNTNTVEIKRFDLLTAGRDTLKMAAVTKTMNTIKHLLKNGADPRLVRCPQPALLMAVVAQDEKLVNLLVSHGVDVNETYPAVRNYYALDIAVLNPITSENLQIIEILVRNGADVHHRLSGIDQSGPTLLHILLEKRIETFAQKQIICQIFRTLVEHSCDPSAMYKGRSVIDLILHKQKLELLNSIVKTSKADLNRTINDKNQTILVALFNPPLAIKIDIQERLRLIGNLLHYGADPFSPCQDKDKTYLNIFDYAQQSFASLDEEIAKSNPAKASKFDGNKKEKETVEPQNVGTEKDVSYAEVVKHNYRRSINLVMDFARDWLARWLRVKLIRDLLPLVLINKSFTWDLIVKEFKNQKVTGLWLSAERTLEIWKILATSKWKVFKDERLLKMMLCVIHYCHYTKGRNLKHVVSSDEKYRVITYATRLICESHALSSIFPKPRRVPYVIPEFYTGSEEKYDICYECLMPPKDGTPFACPECRLIKFCNMRCLKRNILARPEDHPCSDYLKQLYDFKSIDEEEEASNTTTLTLFK